MGILIGGVGQLYQGDLDVGRHAIERLAREDLDTYVSLEDFHYGAIAVSQRLEELRPPHLVLVGAVDRGRPPGMVERRRITALALPADDVQRAVMDAGTGYVTLDLVVQVGGAFGALPARTIAVEVEPARTEPSETLSAEAERALAEALELVRGEIRRAPLLQLAEDLRPLAEDGHISASPALDAMRRLLDEVEVLDLEGRWGAIFALRDRLRWRISAGDTGEGMSHLDWGLWWGLIEELDRLQPSETSSL